MSKVMIYHSNRGEGAVVLESLTLLRRVGEAGDARGWYGLGQMLDLGQGAPRNQQAAVTYYEKAASLGHGGAHLKLGVLHLDEVVTYSTRALALHHFVQAGQAGESIAAFFVGMLYGTDHPALAADLPRAVWWMLRFIELSPDSVTCQDLTAKLGQEWDLVFDDAAAHREQLVAYIGLCRTPGSTAEIAAQRDAVVAALSKAQQEWVWHTMMEEWM
jgi:hypothetical protein